VCTFAYTGSEQSLTVPANTTQVTVTAVGAPAGISTATRAGTARP
jgi:hypothetical protein